MADCKTFVIDLRSDTVTKPTTAMRQAMADAIVGDDVMREDPTVIELENYAAELLGMESALFVPTGTMGNLAAIMSHCYIRGQELLVGDLSHIHINEQGGAAQIANVHHRTLHTKPDGTLCLDELVSKIRSDDIHYPKTGLFCLENTHNLCGGTVLPLEYLKKAGDICKSYGIPLHMDGARIFNASIHMERPVKDILAHCDSVSVCLSKGLGAPAGTILAGKSDFIHRALRCRKALGGGMRQSGILAAAGLISLKDMVERLKDDHMHAQILASEINKVQSDVLTVNMNTVQSNLVYAEVNEKILTDKQFCKRLYEVSESEVEEIGAEVRLKVNPARSPNSVRFVFHADISPAEAKMVVDKVVWVIKETDKTI